MKKRIISFLLAVCLIVCALPAEKADAISDVCFVSLNDRLLDLSSQALYVNGTMYVPCSVFSDFHIYYSYFSSNTTAMLFTSSKQIYLDIKNGATYDQNGHYYSAPGYLQNGTAYVPVSFACSQFGLNWSFISGDGSGDICRIKDSTVYLSDAQFLSAASDMMASSYKAYKNASSPSTGTPSPSQPAAGTPVYLSFQGLPSAKILDTFSTSGYKATFFLEYSDIKTDPDTVRRIVGEGHGVGIICADFEQYTKTSAILYEAARIKTLLVASEDSAAACKTMAARSGLVFCGYNADGVQNGSGLTASAYITSMVGTYGGCYARLLCVSATERNLPYLLQTLSNSSCLIRPVDEINHG